MCNCVKEKTKSYKSIMDHRACLRKTVTIATAYYPVGIYWSDYGIAIPTKLNNQNVEIKFDSNLFKIITILYIYLILNKYIYVIYNL